MGVGEELGDDAGFSDDGSVVGEGGDEAAGVDLEVFGCAGDGEVDYLLCEGKAEFCEGDVGTVSPGAAVVGVEDDAGSAGRTHREVSFACCVVV